MKTYLKLMRIHHYIKNILIFLPLIFSHQLFNVEYFIKTVYGFIAFSLMTSVIYILNDVKDIENDRNHPTKKNRPLASGAITKSNAYRLLAMLMILSSWFIYLSCGTSIIPVIWMIAYLVINIGYSFGLKNVPILDITILVAGFVIRVLFGSSITNIEISSWLYLTILTASFYMGLGKRRNELIHSKEYETRKVLKYYNKDFLDKSMTIFMTLALAFYSLWCMDGTTIERVGTNIIIWTIPFVIIILLKYSLDIEHESDGDPVEVIFRDKWLLALILLFGLFMLAIMYIR